MSSTLPPMFLALLLPWLLGYMLAKWLIGAGHPRSTHLGYGYFLGMLFIAFVIRGWDALGQPLNFWAIMGVILLLISGVYIVSRCTRSSAYPATIPLWPLRLEYSRPLWKLLTVVLLCLAILAHLTGNIQELWLRPTFPWDAWASWQPEAIQYFTNKSLYAPVNTNPNYGELTTLILLWMMLASGETYEPFLHLPWLGIYIALGAIIYGHLSENNGKLWGLTGCLLVLSLPYLNLHTALAGYADIWVTLIYAAAIFSLSRYLQTRRIGELILFLLLVVACAYAKRAGAGFAIALLSTAAISWMFRAKTIVALPIAGLCILGLAVILLVISGVISLVIPLGAERSLTFTTSGLSITGLLEFRLSPAWNPVPLSEALFQYSSWHLASWYWCALAIVLIARRQWHALGSPECLGIALGLAICLLFFYLQPTSAADHTRLSRVLLYVMPLAAVMLINITAPLQLTPAQHAQRLP